MTLPCDASRQMHPENRAGKYTTMLAREVILDGEYEVGLSECVIPIPRNSLNFKQPLIIQERGAGFKNFDVDARDISTISDLEALNAPLHKDGRDAFKIS